MSVHPIACSLSQDELRRDARDLLPGLADAAHTVEWMPDGVRMEFHAADGLAARIGRVIDRERVCCRFLRFGLDVSPDGGPIVLSVTGPPGTAETLREILSDDAAGST